MKGFGSDNHSGVHPDLLAAILNANLHHAPSYGTDDDSAKATALFKKEFGQNSKVFFVFNGTACNVLALKSVMKSHESVLCSSVSHLHNDECGAPEFFAGKLIPLPHENGKLKLSTLKNAMVRKGDQHYSQPKVVSLTQPTELGTCYSLDEIKSITEWAHSENMVVHLDGARISNAVHFLKTTFKKMTTDLGVDIVSFGGTKNGFLMGEAIVVLNPSLATDLKYIRKQAGQLPSKTRFIAAQFQTYLSNQLFEKISDHSCKMATRLASRLQNISRIEITEPVESNAVFVKIPQAWVKTLREKFFFYVWDEKTFECRLMTTWDTTETEIDEFTDLVRQLSLN
jgi:threonine aldolase